MPQPRLIDQTKQLLVEGRDAVVFFTAFIAHLGLSGIQLQNFGGITELRGFLNALTLSPGFQEKVTSIGIIRDAETNPLAAFQSVCGALSNAKLPVPPIPELVTGTTPSVNVLILPDAQRAGMLETLCLDSLAGDAAVVCVEQYFSCLQQQLGSLPNNLAKARLHAWLASRPKSGLLLGEAASAGYFDWAAQSFNHVKQFLLALPQTTNL